MAIVKTHPFDLFKVRVQTIDRRKGEPGYEPGSGFTCEHVLGESFMVKGEMIYTDRCKRISQYVLAALLPHLPARQRPLQKNDWMMEDAVIACPDPDCSAGFRLKRFGRYTVYRSQTSGVHQARNRRPR